MSLSKRLISWQSINDLVISGQLELGLTNPLSFITQSGTLFNFCYHFSFNYSAILPHGKCFFFILEIILNGIVLHKICALEKEKDNSMMCFVYVELVIK